jgi:hypothetical protein
MKTRFALIVYSVLFTSPAVIAQSTAFTYQGHLSAGGANATGLYEMSFALYDAPTNGNVVGAPLTAAPIPVTNGLFTVTLDFGGTAFSGAARWLEISLTVFGSDQPVTALGPRQPLTPAPYAIHTFNAANFMSFGNAPLDIKVNGKRALRLEPTPLYDSQVAGAPNVIGGSSANVVSYDAHLCRRGNAIYVASNDIY